MPRAPFDPSVIRLAGAGPATGTREGACRNPRRDRDLHVPPAEWLALADAESAGACFSVPIRNADECWHLVNRAWATPHQATPL